MTNGAGYAESRYRVTFEMKKGNDELDPVFDIWINEEEGLHKKLVHHMALAMASERWGVPIMGAKTTDPDVLGMCKDYELRRIKTL